jgi:hypothetical protein
MTNSRNTNNTTVSTSPTMRRGTSANELAVDQKVKKRNSSRNQRIKWVQIRLVPIWLRVLIILVLLFIAVVAGLTVGYSILGDGESSEVLQWSTWQHLIDIIKGKE